MWVSVFLDRKMRRRDMHAWAMGDLERGSCETERQDNHKTTSQNTFNITWPLLLAFVKMGGGGGGSGFAVIDSGCALMSTISSSSSSSSSYSILLNLSLERTEKQKRFCVCVLRD